jgi:hypothetical protein
MSRVLVIGGPWALLFMGSLHPRKSQNHVGRCHEGNDPVEAKGLEPSNLLTASQALYQLSYAPSGGGER